MKTLFCLILSILLTFFMWGCFLKNSNKNLATSPSTPNEKKENPKENGAELNQAIDTGTYNTKEYTVGSGDILTVTLWKKTGSESHEVRVSEEGNVSFLLVENQKVDAMTLSEIRKILTEKLSKYFNEPRVDVIIKEYQSQKVTLLGAINTIPNLAKSGAGVYTLERPTRLVELVTQAGGFKDSANLTDVVITRKDGKKIKLDLKEVVSKLENNKNIMLLPGDLIFIPDKQETSMKISVIGEVANPGVHEVPVGATIIDAISKFGGFREFGSPNKSRIIRKGKNNVPYDIHVNMKKILDGDYKLNIKLEDGDIIYVPQ